MPLRNKYLFLPLRLAGPNLSIRHFLERLPSIQIDYRLVKIQVFRSFWWRRRACRSPKTRLTYPKGCIDELPELGGRTEPA